ncbi:MAG: hypothetical protein KME20_22140 [Kaiparowitsia implicata GSE-PSE-MK54-09C]|jgi:hypothetical protein|nr:hypothetical protein [Kaiparowitsia implicata GSE-PSE-MK54-09C]
MAYQHQLNPWVIHQLLPSLKQHTIARFRSRAEAEGYVKVVTRLTPNAKFAIAFDAGSASPTKSTAKPAATPSMPSAKVKVSIS